MSNLKNNNLVVRTISGAVLVVIIGVCGYVGGFLLLALTAFTSLVGLYELYRVVGVMKAAEKKDNMLAYTGFILAAVYYIFVAMGGLLPKGISIDLNNWDSLVGAVSNFDNLHNIMNMSYINLICCFTIVAIGAFMIVYVFSFPRFNITEVTHAIFGVIYVPVFLSCMYLVRGLQGGKSLIWLIFISSWICDTCAYFTGSAIGKHKLAPILSPKKSIEGAIGGIAGSVIVAFIFGYCIEFMLLGGANNAIEYMIICGVGAIVSQVGDLAASGIKRNFEIKDYGTLIPGHGGIMDRFDSVIFAAPFIYLLAQILL